MRNVLTQFTLIFYLDTIHVHVQFYLSKLKIRDPFNVLFMCLLYGIKFTYLFLSQSPYFIYQVFQREIELNMISEQLYFYERK